MLDSSSTVGSRHYPAPVQKAALGVGVALFLIGVLGFIPGATSNYDDLFAGQESRALLLGVFQVSVLHNLIHLLFGVGGMVAGSVVGWARMYLIVGSLFFGLLWVYGLAATLNPALNVLSFNTADNWLNCVLFAGMFGLGLLHPVRARRRTSYRKAPASFRR